MGARRLVIASSAPSKSDCELTSSSLPRLTRALLQRGVGSAGSGAQDAMEAAAGAHSGRRSAHSAARAAHQRQEETLGQREACVPRAIAQPFQHCSSQFSLASAKCGSWATCSSNRTSIRRPRAASNRTRSSGERTVRLHAHTPSSLQIPGWTPHQRAILEQRQSCLLA